ncbi:MAG: fibronectin type III-like domain-contianing protein [Ignavibacteriota bacterium]
MTNTGARAGDEVVQLYVKYPASKVERPRQQLAGFQRVSLQAKETKTVKIVLPVSRLAYWDVKTKAFQVESGAIGLMAGDSSANLPLSGTVTVR